MKSFFVKFFRAINVSNLHLYRWFLPFIFFVNFSSTAADYTITVTATGSSNYIFNSSGLNFTNVNDPSITVNVGDKLTFDVSGVSAAHPFAIVSQLTAGNGYASSNEVSGVENNGEPAVSSVIWDLTGVTPGTYYYVCTLHPNMRGTITVNSSSSGTDTDGDGVPDDVDVDDDNDGITDILEGGETLDTDGDGLPNRIDPDSDDDLCFDVIEAGYGDIDDPSDGEVGTKPTEYTEDGKVKNINYFTLTDIDDLDGNGVKDFLEKGSSLSKTLDPVSVNVLEYSKVTFSGGGETVEDLGTIVYAWQITDDDGNVWQNLSAYITDNPTHPGKYTGVDSTVLVVDSVTASMDQYAYRLYMQTPAFKCDNDVTTNKATLSVFKLDTDGDGVPDEIDADDDNDGIKDVDEGGETLDTDGDGIPNRIDLDSDGDKCNDVDEAGLSTDENNDGMVGIPIVNVNAAGLVTSTGDGPYSYGTPDDLDGNGTADYLQAGADATVGSSPSNSTVSNNTKTIFVASGSSDCEIDYTWQVSTDAGTTWNEIDDFNALGQQSEIMIVGGGHPINHGSGYHSFLELYANDDIIADKYKVVLTLPDGTTQQELVIRNSIAKGKYITFGSDNRGWVDFFGGVVRTLYNNKNNSYGQHYPWSTVGYLRGEFIVEIKTNDTKELVVDRFGSVSSDGAPPWFVNKGFFKRKDNLYADSTFRSTDWIICPDCLTEPKNNDNTTPYDWGNVVLPDTTIYTGLKDDTLVIHSARPYMDRYQYRAKIRSSCHACDLGSFTDGAELVVFLDSDGDGVGDTDDQDDDNDGIIDTKEGAADDDFDADGIPNRLDLDADGDGCNDVIEAGFADPDGDGIVGTGKPSVGTDGTVTGHSYDNPLDADSNTALDFLQFNTDIRIFSDPDSVFIDEEEDTIFIAQATEFSNHDGFWSAQPDNGTGYDYAFVDKSDGERHYGWSDQREAESYSFVVEFNSLINDDKGPDFKFLTQFRGHSYYLSNTATNFDNAVAKSQEIGGYLLVVNDAYESEKIRESIRRDGGKTFRFSYWINYFQDTSLDTYSEDDGGWVSGFIPNSAIYQWQVSSDGGTSWTDVTDGTNYVGSSNDTLKVKSAPASFNNNLYRLKATTISYGCTEGPKYSKAALLTVSSDPDNDGVKNSEDLDDDNDGILDTKEGSGDLDGDGIPNRLDLDSDNDGCPDAQEAGFTGYDSDGRLCNDSNCADSDGTVTGHEYPDPADGDGTGIADFLEAGQSPSITTDLPTITIAAKNSSKNISITGSIPDIQSNTTYTNWGDRQPDNSGGREHYADMLTSTGKWNDNRIWANRRYIIEFNTPTSEDKEPLFTKLTDYNGHSYYISKGVFQAEAAYNHARENGGYVVVMNDAAENEVIRSAAFAKEGVGNIWVWIGHRQDKSSDNWDNYGFEPDGGWEGVSYGSVISYQWQLSTDSVNWTDITASNDTVSVNDTSVVYSGFNTSQLNINPTPAGINGYQVRVILGNSGFKCAVNDTSIVTTLIIRNDFDGDGIEDDADDDDDNDGILDVHEGNGTIDSDGDGDYDSKDLDSDNDGCWDVDEAYGTDPDRDPNNDGVFGDVDATINSTNGRVSGSNSTDGLDLDGNGVKDFQEAGAAITEMSCPGDITAVEGQNINIISTPTGMGSTPVNYIWELSSDTGKTWTDVSNVSESKLIISGIGYGKTKAEYDGVPKFIELYALEDVNLQNYRMESHKSAGSSNNYNWVMKELNKTLKKGEYMLIYYPSNKDNANTFFGDDIDNIYDYTVDEDGFEDNLKDGNDNFTLHSKESGSWKAVDRIGDGVNVLNYDDGWLYRKSNSIPSSIYDPSQWTNCVDCLESATNASASTPFPVKTYNGIKLTYDLSKGDSLLITGSSMGISGYQFRAIASTPSYVCGANDTSCVINLTILPDFDKDSIPDVDDLDDDNDGILDIDEGDLDTDGDGLKNQFDLDSDGDGCFDVEEAGFVDGDSDGIVGSSPVTVDPDNGKVNGVTAYTTPIDGDSNGTSDFLEVGSDIVLTSYLNYYLSETGDTATFIVNYNSVGTVLMQWQISTDNQVTWANVSENDTYKGVNTNTLRVNDIKDTMDEDRFRLMITTPAYDCHDTTYSVVSRINVDPDVDNDGILNSKDLDDDNDGILDTEEGDEDIDGDGIRNRFDLDSDGDDCYDVIEAGFKDKVLLDDEDGQLGDSPITVDSLGRVTSGLLGDGYTDPLDRDSDGTKDYKQYGQSIADAIINQSSLELLSSGSGSFVITASVPGGDKITYQWQESRDDGVSWFNVPEEAPYSGTTTNTLTLTQPSSELSGYKYRIILTIPSYVCAEIPVDLEVSLTVYPDNDKDGVRDSKDDDDDNDGILDTWEGDGDADQDGIKNKFDLDSDGDGCNDVIEAGYLDANADGRLGPEDILFIDSLTSEGINTINGNGRVNGHGGYDGEPNDLDNNFVYDFLEEGAPVTELSCPDSVTVEEGGVAEFVTNATVTAGKVDYQWEISNDSGTTWTDILDAGIMFIGLGEGDYYSNPSRPQFIELYATKDIPDLSKIWIYNYRNGSNNYNFRTRLTTTSGESAKKGDYILLYYDANAFNPYFDSNVTTYDKRYENVNLIYSGLQDGDDVFEIRYGISGSTHELVDVIGNRGEDGTGKSWEYKSGWIKRKINKYPKPKFDVSDWTVCKDCLGDVDKNENAETPYTIRSYSTTESAIGSNSTTLNIRDISYADYHGSWVRAKVSTPAFACDTDTVTCIARISVTPFDTDSDGVPDKDDLDDDNDGILDTDEGGETLDTDSDGIPNRIDLDSDNDGCNDVLEAGFEDSDDDGVIGSGSPSVDSDGKVDGHGYGTPEDKDADGTKDFLQYSENAVVTTQPIDAVRQGGDDAEFSVTVTGDEIIEYQWQYSDDDTATWTDVIAGGYYSDETTSTLKLTAVDEEIDGYYFRVKITTPALSCADPVFSDAAMLTAKDDSDGDGITNNFDLDSDNDGILNNEEGTGDVDGDGIPNYLDLDSDNDGCNDVEEAGYDDPDGDGIPGTGPPEIIPGQGMIVDHPYGVTTGYDSDDNGVKDFLEAGGPIITISSPINVVSAQGKKETFTAGGTAISPLGFKWEVSADNGKTWIDIVETAPYSGVDSSVLVIDPVNTTLNSNLYRAVVSTPGFSCGNDSTTQHARLIALPDNDQDGIQDLYDDDDDNDGILDKDEFIDDLDGDGIPNSFDLDSDGDGCLDVIEAGYLDPDGDGILGDSVDTDGDGIKDSPAIVNSDGRVTSGTGYSTIDDLDNNEVKDFLEVGSQVTIDTQPVATSNISEFSDLQLFVDASAQGTVAYKWQVSEHCDSTWTDLTESPDLMISGVFETKNGYYEGIELYAVNDIEDLSRFGISISNGNVTAQQYPLNSTTLKAGMYYMLYYRSGWEKFFSNESSSPYKSQSIYNVRNLSSGHYNINLWEGTKKVDAYGNSAETASNSAWDTDEGWAYRKNGRGANPTFNINDWNIEKEEYSTIGQSAENGNDIVVNSYPIFKFSNPQQYIGVNNDTLTIAKIPLTFDDLNFRVVVSTPAFKCDTVVISSCSNVKVEAMEDTDGDGVPDYVDLDSDNDGIPDVIEGCDIDTDNDGIPNCLDRDSDNDGCDDVKEAGFTDSDGDGYLGPDDIYVDINGLVTSGDDGYTDPVDLDENGILDYLEEGGQPIVVLDPSTVDVILFDDTIFVGSGNAPGVITQRWQQSDDGTTTFRTLQNTPDLIITGVMEGDRSNSQRPKIIELKALKDIDDLRKYKIVIYHKDSNGDGKIDVEDESNYNYTIHNNKTSLDKGEFFYLHDDYYIARDHLKNSGENGDFDYTKVKSYEISGIRSQMTGDRPIGLSMRDSLTASVWKPVDFVGGSTSDNYNKGWKYRVDTTQVSATYYREQDWNTCKNCLSGKNLNNLASVNYTLLSNGDTLFHDFPIGSYNDPVIISGVNSDTLKIENIPYSMDGYVYNLEMITRGFACDDNVYTNSSTLKVFLPDFDNDKIVDKLDLDADNDGILDSEEGTEDIDGDGFPNYIDLDSDGDGCPDAIEAGFTDPDNDYYLGTSPVDVDPSNGLVINQGGYSTPSAVDLDNNGIKDYKETGSQAVITRQPSNQIYFDEKVKFFVEASSDADMTYQWQSLEDTTGTAWVNITDGGDFSTTTTDTLNVDNISTYSAFWFRVMITTPGFACGDTVYSTNVKIVNSADWDNDGIPDANDIDDDNDGILDNEEGEDVDTDGDGIPNSKDLDSDGDGCNDVIEAGYIDGDDDGYLGLSPVEVTSVGTVIDVGNGYQPPEDDLDENGVYDLLEFGSAAVANTIPSNDTLEAGKNASFTGSFTADGTVTYHWELSTDGVNWTDVVDTVISGADTTLYTGITDTTLNITNVTFAMNDYQYRIVASTPSFKCGPDTPSDPANIKLVGDNDKDGIIDIIDLDDDNDGILDSLETGDDTDGDGIPNWFDLDSDGDGCLDVEEAGFEDPDNDGALCSSPVIVDNLGKVVCVIDAQCEDDPYGTLTSWQSWSSAAYVTDTERTPGYFKLTNNNNNSKGSYFSKTRVDLRGDFRITAEMYFGDKDADGGSGIAFNLFDSNTGRQGLYDGMAMQQKPAVSVEFDTKKNGSFDPESDHSSLHINGNNISGKATLGETQNTAYDINFHGTRPIITKELDNLEDGNWHEFTFNWNASSKRLSVTFKGETIITYDVDIIKDVFSGTTTAYFGFTSDTGNDNNYNEHRVYIKQYCEINTSGSIYKGYSTPNDLDSDGIPDYKEAGDVPEFSDSYEDDDIVIIKEGADTTFTTSVTYSGPGDVVWQMCNEDCSSCTTIEESPGIMLTGVFRGDIGGTEPSSIELYALEDIPDLSVYGIEIARDGDKATGKDYTLKAVSLDSGNYYTISSNAVYQKSWFSTESDQENILSYFDGDDAIVLYKNNDIIDVYGVPGKDGSGEVWEYTLGWAYRKDGRIYSTVFNINDWTTCRGCTLGSSFNDEMDNPFPSNSFAGAPTFTGVDTDELTLKNATESLDGVRFRRSVLDPGYSCLPVSGGDCIRVGIFLDNDNDGIIDEIDLDDDNDGILDSLETEGDTDGDGIPNHFDLDSDGDGCLDVIEAGHTDGDSDGLLGNSPVTVDDKGLVTSGTDGYTTPNDLDNSGGYDFLEFGTIAVLVSSPDTMMTTEGGYPYFVAKGTAVGGNMNNYPFDYEDWVVRGSGQWNSTSSYFTLTNNQWYQKGQIWNKNKIDLSRNFVISANMNFGSRDTNGAHGIAFVLQATGTNAEGSYNEDFGYASGNIENAFAIEFDTYNGGGSYDNNEKLNVSTITSEGRISTEVKSIENLEDNNYHDISFSWDANDKSMIISVDGVVITTVEKDIVSEIFGQEYVWFGFTASTSTNSWSRHNHHYVKDISVSGTYEGDGGSNVSYEWQYSTDSAKTWVDILEKDSLSYSGINNDTLTVIDIEKSMSGSLFRARLFNAGFACDPGVFSKAAMVAVLPDNDKDGITDDIDEDDDNDGILDTKEGDGDLDGDGIPNQFDLDSDGDGCFDVIEAGFDDNDLVFDSILGFIPNPDGILGNSPVTVDEDNGRVIRSNDNTTSQAYFKPKDGDVNGVEDYREVGSAAFITTEPLADRVEENDTIILSTVVDVTGNAVYEWYESRDTGKVWIKLPPFAPYSGVDTDTLSILGAPLSMNGYQYKMIVSTPAYACGENDTSNVVTIGVSNDNDNDGIPNDIDIDDDNDGIVDTLEVIDEENDDDFDNDGIPNHYDLDSDGDGCFDVLEAGFTDPDGDGILCTSPVTVNSVGQVIGCAATGCNEINDEDYNLVGDAEKYTDDGDNEVYRLTPASENKAGSVWSKEKIDLSKDFKVKAKLNLGNRTLAGADGIAFVLQPIASDLGSSGGGLGYRGISPSVAVEFDTYNNSFSGTIFNHAAVIYNGEPYGPHSNLHIFNSIEDGLYHDFEFIWTAATNTLSVMWDGAEIINLTKDIATDIFSGNSDVYYGFTAGTGLYYNTQIVWLESTCTGANSSSVPDDGYTDPLDADGSGVVDYKELDDFTIEINTQPIDIQIPDKTTGYLFVEVNSTDSISYQWQKSSDSINWTSVVDDTTYIDRGSGIYDTMIISGANKDTLFFIGVDTIIDSTYYRVIVDKPMSSCTDPMPSNAAFVTVITDIDLDNDGIPNIEEGYGDLDGDGIPNYLDLDSDNDGIPDVIEGGDGDLDTNGDGMIDENDTGFTDDDEDGMADASEDTPQPDTDGDGKPDFLDIDSDNDGIFDVIEGGDGDLDTNGDGMIDSNDTGFTDDDEDGMADASEDTSQPDYDGDGKPDYLDIDSDNDGIFDVDEGGDGNLDTNNDGVIDSNDTGYVDADGDGMDDNSELTDTPDTDGDGKPDYLDIDSDNDGIFDVVEGGDGNLDTNNDGVIDSNDTGYADVDGDGMDDNSELTPVLDSDGDGKADYVDIDSDNDGIFDVDEGGDGNLDTNNDGVIDSNDSGYADVDGDGMDDAAESTSETDTDSDGRPDYLDIDSDNDGIFDVEEGGDGSLDTNNDGVIDSNDVGYADVDGDGMDDDSEPTTTLDSDNDGQPNYIDIDSDNDGIFDVEEGGDGDLDTNGDGAIDTADSGFTDLDGDGMDDDSENTDIPDSDNDGLPNYLDLDSDNDGIYDIEEGGDGDLDTNQDGVIDSNDTGFADSDNDGMDDASELTPVTETDTDDLPNYLDIDSDNDGIQDVIEGGDGDLDTNGDGVIDENDTGFADVDGDGMDDASELTQVTDTDTDQYPNYIDIDSDNDGIFDVEEGGDGDLDSNNDGVINSNDIGYTDNDSDGMDDDAELTSQNNSDNDLLPDYIDIDSDNDGIHDATESGNGALDNNNDGVIDSNDAGYADSDGDGMDDNSELITTSDFDGDTIPNHLDLDSDNDGIYDVEEGGDADSDTNSDGVIDSLDTGYADADGDGMDDTSESTSVTNTDFTTTNNDGYPDFIDIDSDNDGIQDVIEGGDGILDTNGDGVIDSADTGFIDDDNDGMADLSEDTPVIDSDGDGANDYQDLDADNDGIFDVVEGGDGINLDLDDDGTLDFSDLDTNNDGMIDSSDDGYTDTNNNGMSDQSEGTGQLNSDAIDLDDNGVIDSLENDGVPNYLDLDSDDDGCNDVIEAGFSDLDGDGILGEGTPEIDDLGQVVTDNDEGYVDPVDSDGNGTLDCYDALVLVVTINTQPQYAGEVYQGENVSYTVDASIDGGLTPEYQWEIGIIEEGETDTTWTDILETSQFNGVTTNTLTINDVSYNDLDNTFYRVRVTANGYKCAFVRTEPVVLDIKIRELHVPDGFSPDGDGINDNWFITGVEFYPNNTVQIYNRWELKVWEIDGYQNDNPQKSFEGLANTGSTDGKILPETVYFYVIDLGETDIDGNEINEDSRIRKGIVYIRRPIE